MSFLDRLGEMAKSLVTMDLQLTHQQEKLGRLEQEASRFNNDLHDTRRDVTDVRERVARLETAREADRAQLVAEVAQFKTEVERAELRLSRLMPPSEPSE